VRRTGTAKTQSTPREVGTHVTGAQQADGPAPDQCRTAADQPCATREIDLRKWRNNMRKTLLVLEGGRPSTSPWCSWVNDPVEDVHITADWVPPPPAPPNPGDDEPPF
jgi:hypothetical protein